MASLDPVFGRELGGFKMRPVLVPSINDLHSKTSMVTVVPGTSTPPPAPFRNVVKVMPAPENGLDEITYFQCHQVRAIDRARLAPLKGGRVGMLSRDDLLSIEHAVAYTLGLPIPADSERLRRELPGKK
jgi:mRNA-degrading endonuclease toxin of MazEF toxin-antitoxin module